MSDHPRCPRCAADVHPPGLFSSAWRCPEHGEVVPLHSAPIPGAEQLSALASSSRVPVWVPWPLPAGWVVTGATHAGDDRSGVVAVIVACSGPAPLGGPADILFVAEEPGVGLGAALAGLGEVDAGPQAAVGVPAAKLVAHGHPTPLWEVTAAPDRAVFVGEAGGCWLTVLAWPDEAGLHLKDHLVLVDLRDAEHTLDLPFGALSPRLPR